MHKLRLLGGFALLALATGGCGLSSGSHERNIVVPADPTLLDYVNPATVTGLTSGSLSEGESARRYVHITYPQIKGAPALGAALHEEAERQLQAFRAVVSAASSDALRPRDPGTGYQHQNQDKNQKQKQNQNSGAGYRTGSKGRGTGYKASRPPARGGARALPLREHLSESAFTSTSLRRPELNVQWQLTAASPDVVGVRLRSGEYVGAGWTRSTKTFWYDRRHDQVVGSTGLLAGKPALREAARLVREGLESRGAAVDRSAVTPTQDRLDSMAFNRMGDLVVEFDDCEIGSCSLGRVAVAVPAWQVQPLLSGTGRLAQAAAVTAPAKTALPPIAPEEGPAQLPPAMGTARPDDKPPLGAGTRAGSGVQAAAPAGPIHRHVDCAKAKCVALTFDDGPGPQTPRVLDALRDGGARATFFAVGANAEANPSVLRRMRDEGHVIGNHAWAHRDLTKLPLNRIIDGLSRTQDVITQGSGRMPALARPPYGVASPDVLEAARRVGVALVGWDVDTRDTPEDPEGRGEDAATITQRAVSGARANAIILLHDTNDATADAVPDILKKLGKKGYTFVTVPELYGSPGMEPGHFYRSATATMVYGP
ncbi:polysaccharide deacetylase family protein [Nonomuraea rhodomycinica]|uniref:Polysaccharide deacetylase family protein n=1 Tax=Nonomuraea rhodomycinica TaxID=1712872 RepID=A0A7Y6MFM2_9ACTN|nr:polysaccharide deacetylase family protein [Nonomuraea rhodomycinica]NUW44944.1 polysaccharide deacetylase family protein [Nonomuraea rhodomycinica]